MTVLSLLASLCRVYSLLNSVQLLEKQTHLRGAHLDGLRSLACSHVRHEVASVLPGSMRQEAVIAEGHALPRGHNLPSGDVC